MGSPASVARWYWKQLASSLPVLRWASLCRRSSFLTVGIAIASYLAAGGVAFLLRGGTVADDPLWYEGSFLVLGSLAPIAGAALSRRWRKA